ncbi:adenylyl-sulfate kinase [Arthrobacter glacialis]|uniref:adenylyl-sulfate kinase n=1 Tax=Arthrobacter glacialis TaxID=1664 RepID=UPI000CD4413C|nr:adenylyl-sulfate kinase [Arthrobacter glacialis]POH60803.1 adenylyl-sulfate kinase [Arthrobacter glacialis]
MNSYRTTPLAPPCIALSGARLDELELLAGGLYTPATGYCLPGAMPESWPGSFTLEVSAADGDVAMLCRSALLTDPDGTPLVRMDVTGLGQGNPGRSFLAGTLTTIRAAEHPPAREFRICSPLPRDERRRTVVTAVFATPPLPSQIVESVDAARAMNAVLWMIAVCGPQCHGSYSVLPVLAELRAVQHLFEDSRVGLVVLPTFGGTSADAEQFRLVVKNLGGDAILDFTTRAPHAVQPALESTKGGTVIFMTGFSGSGKSTLARALTERLQEDTTTPITLLDGDDTRRILSPGLGFSKEDREANIRRLGWVAAQISRVGGTVVCAPIAPFESTRQEVREMAQAVGKFVLVHVCTPLEVCEARDRKGLYAKARNGELTGFTGIDSPYEVPADADFSIDTSFMGIGEAVEKLAENLHTAKPQALEFSG